MRVFDSAVLALSAVALLAAPAQGFRKCRPDAVRVGTVCVDKHEASVWEIPDNNDNKNLIAAVQNGNITSAVFLAAVTQRGATADDYGAGCPNSGAGCKDFYAVSIPGVKPSTAITWFQAVAACRNSGKQLLTNHEWTVAAMGTPDPGADNGTTNCNISTAAAKVNTGSRALCVSDTGAFDMVGNVAEWVADWVDGANVGNTLWSATYGMDRSRVGGNGSATFAFNSFPGALYRGGDFQAGTEAGVFAVSGVSDPGLLTIAAVEVGFRCAREP